MMGDSFFNFIFAFFLFHDDDEKFEKKRKSRTIYNKSLWKMGNINFSETETIVYNTNTFGFDV